MSVQEIPRFQVQKGCSSMTNVTDIIAFTLLDSKWLHQLVVKKTAQGILCLI